MTRFLTLLEAPENSGGVNHLSIEEASNAEDAIKAAADGMYFRQDLFNWKGYAFELFAPHLIVSAETEIVTKEPRA